MSVLKEGLGAPWRGYAADPFWTRYDVVIATMGGPRRSYEVWVRGGLFATRPTLLEAQQAVEKVYGGLRWTRRRLDPVKVEHYYFGPTTEFTNPFTIWTADLP